MFLDLVFQLLPAFGLMLTFASLMYLLVMRRETKGIFVAFYTLHSIDLLLGISLFYAGFYGILANVYGNESDDINPYKCLFSAVHLHIWCFVDVANLILLILFCVDQFTSVIFTKRHNQIAGYYFNPGAILLMFTASFVVYVPAWFHSVGLANNSSVKVSSYCWFHDVVGNDFYGVELGARKWVPAVGLLILGLTCIILLFLQLTQSWNFKWSDNNVESSKLYFLTLSRALLLFISVQMPLLIVEKTYTKEAVAEQVRPMKELMIRITQAIAFSVIQPMVNVALLPSFSAKIREFFNLTEQKRTWQSAGDPPTSKNVGMTSSNWNSLFGSYYSTTGNIVGEAGIPYELNANVQRSVSFYYDNDNK